MAIDYNAWATKYDDTRGVSPSVLPPLLAALGPANDRRLLEIGGGTGNYALALASAGFYVAHSDPSHGMVQRAATKLGGTLGHVIADGQALPFADGSFDCAVAIKVINHVPDRPAFARESLRVLGTGPFVMLHATRESIEANWVSHYAPSLLTLERFQPEAETVEILRGAGYARVEVGHIRYSDIADGSALALKHSPETFLTDEHIMNTSLFSRMADGEREAALAAIRRDYRSGRLQEVISSYEPACERHGDGSVFVAYPQLKAHARGPGV